MEDLSFFLSAVYVVVLLKYSFLSFVFPGGSVGKESACNAGDLGLMPGLGDSLEKGKATHSNILAWRISWTVWSMGSQRVGHD